MSDWNRRPRKPRKPKAGHIARPSQSTPRPPRVKRSPDPKKVRDIGKYLDAIQGPREEVTRDGTISDALRVMMATTNNLSRVVDEDFDNAHREMDFHDAESQPPTVAAELGEMEADIDVAVCTTLHNAILARDSKEPSGQDEDIISVTIKSNWFKVFGAEAEAKRYLLGDSLSQFLQNIDVFDPSHSPGPGVLQVPSPATMFGEDDDSICWGNAYDGGKCILLYKTSGSDGGRTGGLIYALETRKCCWRGSLYDRPGDDLDWGSLQDALLAYLEETETEQPVGLALEYRPKPKPMEVVAAAG